jgi:hypothetical protein
LKPIPLSIPSFFSQAFFSKVCQELPSVALANQEKIGFAFKRLSIAIGARSEKSKKAKKVSDFSIFQSFQSQYPYLTKEKFDL